MGGLGISHWIIILVIVLVLFGAGRVSNIMGEVGKGIKSFKQGMADEDDDNYRRYEQRRADEERRTREQRQLSGDVGPREPIDVTPRASEAAPPPPPPPPRDEEAR